jgi:hypothetical protein
LRLLLLAYLRGWLSPEHQKQGLRSALRQELILSVLDRELVAQELRDQTQLQSATLGALGARLEGADIGQFSTQLVAQIRRAHQLLGYDRLDAIQASSTRLSVDAMFALYQAMLDKGLIQKKP